VRTLVIWPLGGEVAGFAESEMRVVNLEEKAGSD